MRDTDGGGRCRKQKFQCGIVFDKEIFFQRTPRDTLDGGRYRSSFAADVAAASID